MLLRCQVKHWAELTNGRGRSERNVRGDPWSSSVSRGWSGALGYFTNDC